MKYLKIYAAFMALVLLFMLPACKKDKAEPAAGKMIVGKWFITNVDTGVPSEALSECDKKTFFQFRNEGTFYAENHYIDGGECTYSSGAGSYSITTDHKYIIINQNGTSVQAEIKNLTATNLVLFDMSTEYTLYFEKK